MSGYVKERLIAIPYEALSQDACLGLQNLLHKFLIEKSDKKWQLVQSVSTPRITMPEDSARSEAPDWSKMRMFVDRCYRYRQSDKNILVQFCKDFMTINVASQAADSVPCPTFDELAEAFRELLPFVRDTLIENVRLRDFQYEVVYFLSEDHLRPLLSTRYQNGKLDYLNVFGLLRSFSSDVNHDKWELEIPLRQELVYHIKDDADKKRLKIKTFVNNDNRAGWFASIDFVASSKRIQDMKTSDERLNAFVAILPQYNEFQRQGMRRLLTDEMSQHIEGLEK